LAQTDLIKFGQKGEWVLFLDHHRRVWVSIHASIAWGSQEISKVSDLGQKLPKFEWARFDRK
jgi:hypothetical protein